MGAAVLCGHPCACLPYGSTPAARLRKPYTALSATVLCMTCSIGVKEEPGTEPGSEALEEGDDGYIMLPKSTSRAALKKGIECPYLDTVSRQVRRRLLQT